MEPVNRIEITDREGWRKEFVCQKRLIYIGSDPRNDIVLPPLRGVGVVPRHLQLIAAPSTGWTSSIVNLSQSAVPTGLSGDRSLEPKTAMEINDGAIFHLGDFTVVIHFQATAAPAALEPSFRETASRPAAGPTSASIGLRISMPQQPLGTEAPLEGVIYVSNLGSKPGVQFNLALEGLPPDCYEIGPAPILFPGAEKGVSFRIFHPRRPAIVAGAHTLCFVATAEEAYPGDGVTVSREIRIAPFYNHSLRFLSLD
jgi:hypothetical protein